MSRKRVLRVTEAVKRELGFILDRQVEDPRIGMVTVTRVDLSDDLRYAKVHVSFLGGDEEKARGLKLLKAEGCGEVQTPLRLPDGRGVALGDPIFFRPAKAGEIAERFTHYLLKRDDAIIGKARTYRGLGQCFY